MIKNSLLLLLVCITLFPGLVPLQGQQYDQNWPVGILEYPGNSLYGNAIIRFEGSTPIVEKHDLKMNFERTVAAMSDSLGTLLFYSNGCYIATANGDTMLNGAEINPGTMHDWVCPENGYNVQRGMLVLPDPGNSMRYYLFHLGARYTPNDGLSTGPLYYSLIDMSVENGEGAVVSINNVLLDSLPESFTAIRHGNGRDWWVVCPIYGTNRYERFLLVPEGVISAGAVFTGPSVNCTRTGVLAASPDGTKLARTQNCRTVVLDFDRCSGSLTNPIIFERSPNVFAGGGAAFSENGERLLLSEHMAILQADLTAASPQLDTVVPFDSLIGRGLQIMERGPNGKLYFSLPHRGRAIPVLEGLDDDNISFNKTGLQLPVYSVRSLPHFPNYRLYDFADSPCDTLDIDTPVITKDMETTIDDFSIYPNPSSGVVRLSTTIQGYPDYQMIITDLLGNTILSERMIIPGMTIDLSNHPEGVYYVHLKKGLTFITMMKLVIIR